MYHVYVKSFIQMDEKRVRVRQSAKKADKALKSILHQVSSSKLLSQRYLNDITFHASLWPFLILTLIILKEDKFLVFNGYTEKQQGNHFHSTNDVLKNAKITTSL